MVHFKCTTIILLQIWCITRPHHYYQFIVNMMHYKCKYLLYFYFIYDALQVYNFNIILLHICALQVHNFTINLLQKWCTTSAHHYYHFIVNILLYKSANLLSFNGNNGALQVHTLTLILLQIGFSTIIRLYCHFIANMVHYKCPHLL